MKKVYALLSNLAVTLTLVTAATFVSNAQNVGVGSATPSEKLDVNGAVRVGNTASTNAGSIRYISGTQQFQVNIGGTWYDIATGNLAYINNFSYNATTNELSITEGSTVHTVDLDDLQDNTDDQNLSLSGTDLIIEDGNTLSMASFMDNTDNQALSYNATTNILTLQNGGTVDLTELQDNTDDQTLSISSNNLTIEDGNSVSLAPYLDNTDSQTLTYTAGTNTLALQNGGSVDLSELEDNTDDQILILSGNDLSIEAGNTVDLSGYVNTDDQTLSYNTTTNVLTIEGGNNVNLTELQDNTDDQTLTLSSNTLSIEDGNSVNLASYVNTDDQTLSISSNNLSIEDGNSVSLVPYLDNTDDQNLTLSGNDLSIEAGNSVDLSGYLDNTDDQNLTLAGNDLSIEAGNSVDLSGYLDNTDDQNLTLSGNTLSIEAGNSVNLSGYLDNTDEQTLAEVYDEGGNDVQLTAADGDVRFYRGTDTEMLFLDESTSNVGVGTTVPDGKLEVNTSGTSGWDKLVVKNTSLWGDGTSSPSETAGTPYVTIGAGANGIMLSNPHVVWNNSSGAAGVRYGRSGGVSSGVWWEGGVNGGNGFHIRQSTTVGSGLEINSSGNIGVGTSTPAQALELYRENLDVAIRLHDPGDAHYAIGIDQSDSRKFKINYGSGVGDASHFTMTTGGSVGIGSNTPSQRLDVSGDINASSGYRIGNTAASGQYLRGNGTRFVSSAIQAGDLPNGIGNAWQRSGSTVHLANSGDAVGVGNSNPSANDKMKISGGHLNLGGNSDPSGSQGNNWLTWGYRSDDNPYYAIFTEYYNNGYSTHSRLSVNWHTGIEIGASPTYGGVRFYNNSPAVGSPTEIFSVGEGDNYVRVNERIYSPIYYDLNNGGYYLDPNSTSHLYRIRAAENIYNAGWYRGGTSDNGHVRLYGNSRQMVFRTDGTTQYSNNGGYPFVWLYGGDNSGNRRMILNSSGQIWTSAYGWLHDYVNNGSIQNQYSSAQSAEFWVSGRGRINGEFYVGNWVRPLTNDGVYWSSTGWHLYPVNTTDFYLRSGNTSNVALRLVAGNTTPRAYLYATSSNEFGILNNARQWHLRSETADGQSPNLYWYESGNESWSGNPSGDMGKIEYHSNRFYIAAGSNSSEIARFRRSGSDVGVIVNDGGANFPVFRDYNSTGYYLDPASTSEAALRIRGGAYHGPNVSWGRYLVVGGNGRAYINNGSIATVATTNGNLHIDAASGYHTYLNYYDGNNLYIGRGNNSTRALFDGNGLYLYDGWLRPHGANGIYFQSYGGGWRMVDSSWIRNYNSKAVRSDMPSAGYYGFYTNGYVGCYGIIYVSTRDVKHDIQKFERDDYESAVAFLDDLELNYYKRNGDERNLIHVGFISEETPSNLTGPNKKGVRYGELSIYNTGALKVMKEEMDEMKSQLRNISDFGADNIYTPSKWIEFSDEFKNRLGANEDPIVVVTPAQTGKVLTLKEITKEGFEIENPSNEGVTFSWIAMGKADDSKKLGNMKKSAKFERMMESADEAVKFAPQDIDFNENLPEEPYDVRPEDVPVPELHPEYELNPPPGYGEEVGPLYPEDAGPIENTNPNAEETKTSVIENVDDKTNQAISPLDYEVKPIERQERNLSPEYNNKR